MRGQTLESWDEEEIGEETLGRGMRGEEQKRKGWETKEDRWEGIEGRV